MYLDRQVSSKMYWKHSDGPSRRILQAFELSGDGLLWIPLIAIAKMTPSLVASELNDCVWKLLVGCVLDLIVVASLKAFFRRSRPSYNKDDMHIVVSVDKFSFPSGHSSRCIFIGALAYYCIAHREIRIVMYIWATLTAMSRVALGRHFLGDVLAGSCIGVGMATFLIRHPFAEYVLTFMPVFINPS
mmetsp:Transcript_31134/g.43152  ORF Transcript_31134/g.43152 Transcript_31134/m.43152 type:complete len:187 (-) Transcript_31134:95-655(-)